MSESVFYLCLLVISLTGIAFYVLPVAATAGLISHDYAGGLMMGFSFVVAFYLWPFLAAAIVGGLISLVLCLIRGPSQARKRIGARIGVWLAAIVVTAGIGELMLIVGPIFALPCGVALLIVGYLPLRWLVISG